MPPVTSVPHLALAVKYYLVIDFIIKRPLASERPGFEVTIRGVTGVVRDGRYCLCTSGGAPPGLTVMLRSMTGKGYPLDVE